MTPVTARPPPTRRDPVRIGPGPDADLEVALDAAAECYLRIGVARTTAADIARAAGISRATLYRRYGSHEAIFLAVLTRESEAMAADARAHLERLAVDRPGRSGSSRG